MTIKNIIKRLFLSLIIAISFYSCDSDSENETPVVEPEIIENYYFRGTLDGEELKIEKNIYNSHLYSDPNSTSMDFGGSQTIVYSDSPSDYCHGRYACGLIFYNHEENPNNLDTAKMYFSKLPVGNCTLENELAAMSNFLNLETFGYETYPSNEVINGVAFDFFPNNNDFAGVPFSSRFGDNTDATFEITSSQEIETGVFIVEGNFSCKIYNLDDETDFKVLENCDFKIKIRKNLEE